MLFIPENDDEYDNIFFVTSENQTYKNSFRAGETLRKVDEGNVKFEKKGTYLKDGEIKDSFEFE